MRPLVKEKFYDSLGKLFNVIKCKSCIACPYYEGCLPIRDVKLTIRKFEIRYKNELLFKRKNI